MSGDAEQARVVVGAMTGTSMDGIDAAIVRVEGRGLAMRVALVAHRAEPLGAVAAPLRALAERQPMTASEIAAAAWETGELHARLIDRLVESSGVRPDLIACHGQTVYHAPPLSWQLLNPAPIARRFGCPVVIDLRQADLAAGGQGAPITPLSDWVLFRDAGQRRAIVNLGGFCNVTVVVREEETGRRRDDGTTGCEDGGVLENVTGFDVCACNLLLNDVAREVLGVSFDRDGAAAAAGQPDPAAHDALIAMLGDQSRSGRSLGTNDTCTDWVKRYKYAVSANDLAATAVSAVGACIADKVNRSNVDQIILAGGGARNAALVQSIRADSHTSVDISDAVGVPVEARESMCMAVLGALASDGVPITLPHVTGGSTPTSAAGLWILPGGLPFEQADLEPRFINPHSRRRSNPLWFLSECASATSDRPNDGLLGRLT